MRKQILLFATACMTSIFTMAQYNTNHGDHAGNNGVANTSIGYYAGDSITGEFNVFLGALSGRALLNGYDNVYLGYRTASIDKYGAQNVFVGSHAGYHSKNVTQCILMGYEAGANNAGNENIFLGKFAGRNNTSPGQNVFIGNLSGVNNEGINNLFIGYATGNDNVTGKENTFIGYSSGSVSVGGSYNVYLGSKAGLQAHGKKNTYLGAWAGFYASNFEGENVFVGHQSGLSSNGKQNTFLGSESGISNQGQQNVYLGYKAGRDNESGFNNVLIGSFAGARGQVGEENVIIGYRAGDLSHGSRNVFIGPYSGLSVDESDKLYIGNSDDETPLIYGDFAQKNVAINFTNPAPFTFFVNGDAFAMGSWMGSDSRFKENVTDLKDPLEKIMNLKGHSYSYIADGKMPGRNFPEGTHYGFIAQELQKEIPELVQEDVEGYLSVNYDGIIPFLVEAVKEMEDKYSMEINDLKQEIELLKTQLNTNSKGLSDPLSSEILQADNESVLFQNSPNPFNAVTTIKYMISEDMADAIINVYDLQGKQLMKFPDLINGKGEITIPADQLHPGIYYYSLTVNNALIGIKKMVVTE